MTNFRRIESLDEFRKDLKRLLKRFPSLNEDISSFEKSLLTLYHKHNIDNHGIFPIDGLGINDPKIYKVKKFACKSLKGKGAQSGIRITYAYFPAEDRIEYIEIYYKGDQANEDKERIKTYYLKKS